MTLFIFLFTNAAPINAQELYHDTISKIKLWTSGGFGMSRFMFFVSILFAIVSCGQKTQEVMGCSVQEIEEGLQFSCMDQEGNESQGVVRHGEKGATGDMGPQGEMGPGLVVAAQVACIGKIEAWLEKSHYAIDYQESTFSTGDKFLSSVVKTVVEESRVVNVRSASMFVLSSMEMPAVSNGLMEMTRKDMMLKVMFQGQEKAIEIPCAEVAIGF